MRQRYWDEHKGESSCEQDQADGVELDEILDVVHGLEGAFSFSQLRALSLVVVEARQKRQSDHGDLDEA